MNRFTLCAFADEAGASMDEQIRALNDNRIPMLEIRGVEGRNITELSLDEARLLRRRLEDQGITVWSIGSPCGKIGIAEPFAPHLDQFRHTLELAEALGAPCLRLFSFFLNGEHPADCREEVMERLGCMTEAAKGTGVALCHENEKGIYGDTAARCADIHRAFPSLKAVFDPANFIQCGQDTMEAWRLLSEHVHYLHIKDCIAGGRIVPAGRGDGHLAEIIAAFGAQGGSVLTLEPHLSVFDGLSSLENGQTSEIESAYPTQRAAFDAAAKALRALLDA